MNAVLKQLSPVVEKMIELCEQLIIHFGNEQSCLEVRYGKTISDKIFLKIEKDKISVNVTSESKRLIIDRATKKIFVNENFPIAQDISFFAEKLERMAELFTSGWEDIPNLAKHLDKVIQTLPQS